MLPESVLRQAAAEMLDYQGCGMSVMEMSHRTPIYEKIITDAERLLREVMSIPDNYKVLFLQGGASTQFAAVPLNFLPKTGKADYILSGQFSTKAFQEAQKYGDVEVAASTKEINFSAVPIEESLQIRDGIHYLHMCFNNTIYGTRFPYIPKVEAPIIADMSSCILSEPIDVTKFGVIYAGAQKNMSAAGLTVVIIREDLLGNARETTPTMLNYTTMVQHGSMYNTPPTYCIYIAKLVYEWILSLGGLTQMQKMNKQKAALLYDYLDGQDYYVAPVEKSSRSIMNVTFKTKNVELDKEFVMQASARGLVNLKGHRSVGGMRASIYNAMPYEGVEALVDFMKDFATKN